MLIHLIPRMWNTLDTPCRLCAVDIPEIDLHLPADVLATGRPYPNKRYTVGRRNCGRKALEGFLVNVPVVPRQFDVVYTWEVCGHALTHTVTTHVEDTTFDLVSPSILLAGGFDDGRRAWTARRSRRYAGMAPVSIEPFMESFVPALADVRRCLAKDDWQPLYAGGFLLTHRTQEIYLKTLESGRLQSRFFERLPQRDEAFTLKGGVCT